MLADYLPEILRGVLVPPVFCLLPWGHRKIVTLTVAESVVAPDAFTHITLTSDVAGALITDVENKLLPVALAVALTA